MGYHNWDSRVGGFVSVTVLGDVSLRRACGSRSLWSSRRRGRWAYHAIRDITGIRLARQPSRMDVDGPVADGPDASTSERRLPSRWVGRRCSENYSRTLSECHGAIPKGIRLVISAKRCQKTWRVADCERVSDVRPVQRCCCRGRSMPSMPRQ